MMRELRKRLVAVSVWNFLFDGVMTIVHDKKGSRGPKERRPFSFIACCPLVDRLDISFDAHAVISLPHP